MEQPSTFVGIDVSKDRLDVYVLPDGRALSFANDEAGVAELREHLNSRPAIEVLVVMEATNVFWKLAATQLGAAGIRIAVINPRQVRDFAKATGVLAKVGDIIIDGDDIFVLAIWSTSIPRSSGASSACAIASPVIVAIRSAVPAGSTCSWQSMTMPEWGSPSLNPTNAPARQPHF